MRRPRLRSLVTPRSDESGPQFFLRPCLWCGSRPRKLSVQVAVIAGVVRKTRPGQKASRGYETVDRPFRRLMPADVERRQLREDLQLAVRKVVMDPPCHRFPGDVPGQPVNEPGHDDTRDRADPATVSPVPDMSSDILLIGRTTEAGERPAAIASFGSSGRFDIPSIAAISL